MKDYKDFWIGSRTSKREEKDAKEILSKSDVDKFFESMCEEIEEMRPVSLEDIEEENEPNDAVETAFKLGYLQAKKEILKIVDDFEVSILNHADEYLH